MKSTLKSGKITVPPKNLIHSSELLVATILSWTGADVEFLPPSIHRSADIKFRNLIWEIKTPKGGSSRTIENNMRNALKQSCNIIINLELIKRSEAQSLKEVRRQAGLIKGIKHIIVITKQQKMIKIC